MDYEELTSSTDESRLRAPHWFQGPAFLIMHGGYARKPEGLGEWMSCLWHADIFIGRVPALKLTVLLSWLGAILF